MNIILSGRYKFADLIAILSLYGEDLRFDEKLIYLVSISKETIRSISPYSNGLDSDLPIYCCYYWLLDKYIDIPTILEPEQLASKNATQLRNFIDNYFSIYKFRTKFRIEYVKIRNFSNGRIGYCERGNIDYNDPKQNKEDYIWYN